MALGSPPLRNRQRPCRDNRRHHGSTEQRGAVEGRLKKTIPHEKSVPDYCSLMKGDGYSAHVVHATNCAGAGGIRRPGPLRGRPALTLMNTTNGSIDFHPSCGALNFLP